MKMKEFRKKNIEELHFELKNFFREQFNLCMQVMHGRLQQTHLLKQVRRNIARIKTMLTEKTSV